MIGLNRLIHDLTQALPNMKLKKELCQDPAQGYTYIISITSLASNFSMLGLNRLIHYLTPALPNMKLKKELRQDPRRGCIITNLHQGKVYQSSRRKGVGGRGEQPDKIPRKKSKAQDPAQGLYYQELCQDPAQGYTYIISITSLASKFSMLGLNRLIRYLTQAVPNMKLKKELYQDPAGAVLLPIFTNVRCTNLHGGRV